MLISAGLLVLALIDPASESSPPNQIHFHLVSNSTKEFKHPSQYLQGDRCLLARKEDVILKNLSAELASLHTDSVKIHIMD